MLRLPPAAVPAYSDSGTADQHSQQNAQERQKKLIYAFSSHILVLMRSSESLSPGHCCRSQSDTRLRPPGIRPEPSEHALHNLSRPVPQTGRHHLPSHPNSQPLCPALLPAYSNPQRPSAQSCCRFRAGTHLSAPCPARQKCPSQPTASQHNTLF